MILLLVIVAAVVVVSEVILVSDDDVIGSLPSGLLSCKPVLRLILPMAVLLPLAPTLVFTPSSS